MRRTNATSLRGLRGGQWFDVSGSWLPPVASTLRPDGRVPTAAVSVWQVSLGVGMTPGDANGDGTVDINDLTIVLANFGNTAAWSQGDFTGDGTVDINDLTIVLANYGTTYGSSAGPAAVPEPSALLLIGLAVVSLVAVHLSRRR